MAALYGAIRISQRLLGVTGEPTRGDAVDGGQHVD